VTAIDNIFNDIDIDYTLCPIMNGLSDHDAQLLFKKKINLSSSTQHNEVIGTFDKHSLNDFLNELSYEMWDTTFCSEDVNIMFSAFLDTHLKIFYSCFPKKLIQHTPKRVTGLFQE